MVPIGGRTPFPFPFPLPFPVVRPLPGRGAESTDFEDVRLDPPRRFRRPFRPLGRSTLKALPLASGDESRASSLFRGSLPGGCFLVRGAIVSG
jgi:hypothetical protein